MSGRLTEDVALRRPETFVSGRVGLELKRYSQNLAERLKTYEIDGQNGDFIITPIASPKSIYYDERHNIDLLPDLILPAPDWETKIAVSINYCPSKWSESDKVGEETFEILFNHAIYLPIQAVIIDCPESPSSQKIIARVVNRALKHKNGRPLVIFRIELGTTYEYLDEEMRNLNLAGPVIKELSPSGRLSPKSDDSTSMESGYSGGGNASPTTMRPLGYKQYSVTTTQANQQLLGFKSGVFVDDWCRWNSLRQHLEPDCRIGVCLSIEQDVEFDDPALQRWNGEPVRMIVLGCDRFLNQPSCRGSTRLSGRVKEFVRTVVLANSFFPALIVRAIPDHDMQIYLRCLSQLSAHFDKQHHDYLRGWNDSLMTPLQPLSNNLDSRTYQVFELDRTKYERYQTAMEEALDFIMMKPESKTRTRFSLMVLGAGRGPLVDAMIKSILSLKLDKNFKIYALDKNISSVQSLKYKQAYRWSKVAKNIEIEVVNADMRFWQPSEKADLIATELLGSLSDNELSPECIDGTWRFSTPSTISIPESYTSYIAPICSFKMHQELNIRSGEEVFDQIYVVRLSNIFTISEPQPLFTFEHLNLSNQPIEGSNQRDKKLTFFTPLNITCHGFAGYFSAKLFGSSTISTVPSFQTTSMDSWFPAYIPLETPVQLAANTRLEISFSRRESKTHVWYEWSVLSPVTSRIHSKDGNASAMSKV